tara:strand:- start:488 stop:1081 length:594 start_codon:yes stop_codon:yes gene_type:complete
MAIGFSVTNITDRKIIPDKTLSRQSNPRVRTQSFGDGYEQRLAEGINNIVDMFSLAFSNRTKEEADDIIAFFEAKGGVDAFDFTIPDTNSTSVTTSTNAGATSSSLTVNITSANLDISVGATLSAASGITGTPKVTKVTGTDILVDTVQSMPSGAIALTFTNPNERTIKVVSDSWSMSFSSQDFYTVQTSFRRVYEP